MKTIEITEKEAELVSDLLDLYEAAYWNMSSAHDFYCKCDFCKALGNSSIHSSKTFESLTNKTKP